MSRNELVHKLAEAGMANDRKALQRTMDALITEARAEHAHGFAERLESVVAKPQSANGAGHRRSSSALPNDIAALATEIRPRRRLKDLVLSSELEASVRDFLDEFAHSDLLRAHSLEPRHTVLLVGPPGNGKTSLAEAIAAETGLTFLTVRYDGLIGSFLGETGSRLVKLIQFASTRPCLLFFDEFDAVGKERDDANDMGEMKRVVSSLLLHMDSLPSRSIVVCATNHPDMLDRAVWRRFELKLQMAAPGSAEIAAMYQRLRRSVSGQLPASAETFVTMMAGENFSEIEAFSLDVRRQLVIGMGAVTPAAAFEKAAIRRASSYRPERARVTPDARQSAAPKTATRPKRSSKNTRKKAAVSKQAELPGTG